MMPDVCCRRIPRGHRGCQLMPFPSGTAVRLVSFFYSFIVCTLPLPPGENAKGDACELFRLYPLSSSTPCSFNVSPRKSRVLPAVPGTCFLPVSVCIMTLFSSTQPLTHGSSDAEQIKKLRKEKHSHTYKQ